MRIAAGRRSYIIVAVLDRFLPRSICYVGAASRRDLFHYTGLLAGLFLLALQDAIRLNILERIPLFQMPAHTPLVLHADLLHHSSRSRVAGEVSGEDAMQANYVESVAQDGCRRLGCIALAPVLLADPITKLRSGMRRSNIQPDCAD